VAGNRFRSWEGTSALAPATSQSTERFKVEADGIVEVTKDPHFMMVRRLDRLFENFNDREAEAVIADAKDA
jgi:predicted phosphoribosyltransferase